MRIFLYELQKLWRWRLLLIIAIGGILTWFAFQKPEIRDYNNNANNIYGDWQNEMFARYGPTLSPAELADFDIPGKRAELEKKMDALIAAEPLFAEYGVSTFAEYESLYLAIDTSVMSEAELKKLQADREAMQTQLWDLRSQWLKLDNIEGYYVLFLERNIGMSRNGYSPIITDAENHYINASERNLTRYGIHDSFSAYAMVTGVFAIIAVLLLTSPLVVTDRRRNMPALQYSSHKGRSMLGVQAIACLSSGLLLGLILVVASFGAFFLLTDAGKYWSSSIGAFDRGIVLYDILFSQYVGILGGMVVALCLGASGLTFLLSRYSIHMATLMLKLVPVGLAIVWLAIQSIPSALATGNYVFNELFHARYHVPEAKLCGAVMLAGIAAAVIVAVRERCAEL